MVHEFVHHVDLNLLELARQQQRCDAEELDPRTSLVNHSRAVGRQWRAPPRDVIEDRESEVHCAIAFAKLEC